MSQTHRGSCLCGAVRVAVEGDMPPADACHCSQCRKWSGHVWASTDVERERIHVEGDEEVSWYRSSEKVRRGFCRTCGSSMFWDVDGRAKLSIAMGIFEQPTGGHLAMHIFVANKGDYYEIADGLPQKD